MADIEKVIAGLTMIADRKNDDSCEGLKCCNIAEDALELLKEMEHKDRMFHALEDDWKRLKELLKEQEKHPVIVCPYCGKRVK